MISSPNPIMRILEVFHTHAMSMPRTAPTLNRLFEPQLHPTHIVRSYGKSSLSVRCMKLILLGENTRSHPPALKMLSWMKSLFGYKALPNEDESPQDDENPKRSRSHKRSHSKRVRDRERELRREHTGQKGDWKKFITRGGAAAMPGAC